jgi:hypothetical protein
LSTLHAARITHHVVEPCEYFPDKNKQAAPRF